MVKIKNIIGTLIIFIHIVISKIHGNRVMKSFFNTGGIGITPLGCIIRYATDNQLKTDIILLYSSRFDDEIIFKNELEEMQGLNNNLKVVHTLTRPSEKWKGLVGRIDKQMIQKVIPDYMERVFYICGPPKMVEAMVEIIKDLNVPEKQIKQEYFPGY